MFKYLICNRHRVFLKNSLWTSTEILSTFATELISKDQSWVRPNKSPNPDPLCLSPTGMRWPALARLLGSKLYHGTTLLPFLTNERMTKAQCPYTLLAILQWEFWICNYKSQILIQEVLPLTALSPKCWLSALHTHTHARTHTHAFCYICKKVFL